MRRSVRSKLDKIAIASIALGFVLLATFGLRALFIGSSDRDPMSNGNEAFVPYGTGRVPGETIAPSDPTSSSQPLSRPLADALGSVGTFGKGGDNTVHSVVMTASSDGGVYAGWRFRGGDDGVRVADKNMVIVEDGVPRSVPIRQQGAFSKGSDGRIYLMGTDGKPLREATEDERTRMAKSLAEQGGTRG